MKFNNKKDTLLLILLSMFIVVGIGLVLSPIYKRRITDKRKITQTIEDFQKTLNENKESSHLDLNELENENQIIGILYVPKIQIILPIYNNTSEYALSNGTGILREYGKPYGKKGTHPILTSHAGLEDGLFTNLKDLEKGDHFYIRDDTGKFSKYTIFGEDTILPDDYSKFIINKDISQVTLLTCTSIEGFNSHRLLKHGKKIKFDKNEFEQEQNKFYLTKYEKIVLSIFAVLILLTVIFVIKRKV